MKVKLIGQVKGKELKKTKKKKKLLFFCKKPECFMAYLAQKKIKVEEKELKP